MRVVDIWQAELKTENAWLTKCYAILDEKEQERAATLKNETARDRYVLVRGILRTILADYLQLAPATLRFSRAEYGKPKLCDYSLFFNLSHSADKLVIAVAEMDGIGVDIEEIKSRSHLPELAQRVLSPEELSVWTKLPASAQLLEFYRLWTKKEAFVKAIGRGLGVGLEKCALAMPSGQLFVRIPEEYGNAADWKIAELNIGTGFAGALVLPNTAITTREINFSYLLSDHKKAAK